MHVERSTIVRARNSRSSLPSSLLTEYVRNLGARGQKLAGLDLRHANNRGQGPIPPDLCRGAGENSVNLLQIDGGLHIDGDNSTQSGGAEQARCGGMGVRGTKNSTA